MVDVDMKLEHTIPYDKQTEWQQWTKDNIGEIGTDFIHVSEPVTIQNDFGAIVYSGYNHYWEIPNPAKAMFWALKWP
jgi:hypothetical protein